MNRLTVKPKQPRPVADAYDQAAALADQQIARAVKQNIPEFQT